MKKLILIITISIGEISSCENKVKTKTETTSVLAGDTILNQERKPVVINKDSSLVLLNKAILTAIKQKDYKQLSTFFHPVEGVRFSPYGYVDTANDLKFIQTSFLQQTLSSKKLLWGKYDGSGEKIELTLPEYFAKFVYNADFLEAPQRSVNKILGNGNSLVNIEKIYPGSDYVENYFPGFDKKYEGMDWTSLRLVFQKFQEKYFLVGIIHDQWTS